MNILIVLRDCHVSTLSHVPTELARYYLRVAVKRHRCSVACCLLRTSIRTSIPWLPANKSYRLAEYALSWAILISLYNSSTVHVYLGFKCSLHECRRKRQHPLLIVRPHGRSRSIANHTRTPSLTIGTLQFLWLASHPIGMKQNSEHEISLMWTNISLGFHVAILHVEIECWTGFV